MLFYVGLLSSITSTTTTQQNTCIEVQWYYKTGCSKTSWLPCFLWNTIQRCLWLNIKCSDAPHPQHQFNKLLFKLNWNNISQRQRQHFLSFCYVWLYLLLSFIDLHRKRWLCLSLWEQFIVAFNWHEQWSLIFTTVWLS